MKKIILIMALLSAVAIQAHADTVHFKDEKAIKGMIIAEYVDRIVFSTVDGEKTLMKKDIEKISYDDSEMNLMSLGDAAFDSQKYKLAHKYYALALEANPELDIIRKKADQAWLFVHKEKEMDSRRLIETKNMLESGHDTVPKETSPAEKLKKGLGIALSRTKEGDFRMDLMSIKSPFRKAGFKAGDRIVSVSSRLTDYLTLKEMTQLLLAQDQHIIKMTLSRKLKAKKKDSAPLGARFRMKWEGMVAESVAPESVFAAAGLKEGDLLVAVNGESIRYTKMKDVLRLFDRSEDIKLIIHRTVTVFKSG